MLRYVDHLPAFDEARVEGGIRPDLFIGPSVDRRHIVEVMAEFAPPDSIFVFPVMIARRKILDRVEGDDLI